VRSRCQWIGSCSPCVYASGLKQGILLLTDAFPLPAHKTEGHLKSFQSTPPKENTLRDVLICYTISYAVRGYDDKVEFDSGCTY
jgi:hypothetical protein